MEIWDYNLRHFAAIGQIAQLGTMGAAARAVNLTQPALTQALARVESQLGLPLFERRHDGMVATPAADLLVPRIRAALDHVPSPHVTTARLRALLALADSGSYLGASLATGLAVPTLHRAVKDLSLSLRKVLVERRSNAVVLTEQGHALARAFRLARIELEAGLAEIEALKGREIRRIAVGAMPLSRAHILPGAVARFLKHHPLVRIAVAEGARNELVEPLRNGMIDMMIGALRDPLVEPDLVQTPLFEDEPIIVARAGHSLAGTQPDLAALARHAWILPGTGAPLRDLWAAMFTDAGLAVPPVPVESGSVMVIRQVLIDSDFLALVSRDQVAVELEANWLCSLGGVPRAFHRVIGVTTRASWRPTAVQARFLADLTSVAKER
jgi:LysR family transcriptional regulator, regulator for genes of the gallate degradation pathway